MELGKSNIRKFLICHEAEYTEGDDSCLQELPLSPILPLEGNLNYVSMYAFRTFYGAYMEKLVSENLDTKMKFVCESEEDLNKLNAAIRDKVLQYGSRIFYFNFPHPNVGWIFTKVYIGTPNSGENPYLDKDNGNNTITKLEFSVIEVEGRVLIN